MRAWALLMLAAWLAGEPLLRSLDDAETRAAHQTPARRPPTANRRRRPAPPAAAAAAAPAPPAPLSACQAAFVAAMRAAGKAGAGDSAALKWAAFIDPATPADACAKPLCQGPFAACDPNAGAPGPLTDLQLVFSDEFVEAGREFGVKAGDPRWTAQDMYYFPTTDLEVYKPEQVTTYSEFGAVCRGLL
jgi:hypothetical protein